MKKLFLISVFLLLLFSRGLGVSAECGNSCKIQDAPAAELEQYIDNVSKLIKNVSAAISKSEPSQEVTQKTKNSILASMSQVINFSGYYSSFDFYVALPITTEVPYPVKRDHQRLIRENQRISLMLKNTVKRGYAEVAVENACDGIQGDCELTGTVRSILTKALDNNKTITDFYRLSILGRNDAPTKTLILVPDNFDSQIQKHYNKSTLYDCSTCDGAFGDRVKKSIDKISNLNSSGTEGIKKWKEAWAQLTGAVGQGTKTSEEDRLLREKLAADGVSGDAAEAVTNNLARYGSGGLSSNNPLFNSANYTFSNAKRDIDSFAEGALQNYLDTDQEEIPIIIITKTTGEVEKTEDIANAIGDLYEKQIPFALIQDTSTEKLISKIIRMHKTLMHSINTLDPTIKVSQEVCNSQGQGDGNCEYN